MNQKQVEFPESETTICEIKISMNDISSRVYLHHRLNKSQWSLRHYNRDLLKWGTSRKETENKKKEKEFQETGNYRALKSQRGEAGKKNGRNCHIFQARLKQQTHRSKNPNEIQAEETILNTHCHSWILCGVKISIKKLCEINTFQRHKICDNLPSAH